MSQAGELLGIASGVGMGVLNNYYAQENYRNNLGLNYQYNEKAAENADKRTRALYNDIYSPGALLKQYEKAGLSPSMMFGGTPGQGGMSGAQGSGAQGAQQTFMPLSMLEGAQIGQILAETARTKAETKNINKDTALKALEEEFNIWRNNEKSTEYDIYTVRITHDDGTESSIFELANNTASYEDFLSELRKAAEKSGADKFKEQINTELGQKTLRKLYYNTFKFDSEIQVLSAEGVAASFQKSIMNALKSKNFADENAKAVIAQLKAMTETNDLTAEQKGAWNRLLDKIEGKFGETGKDIVLILGMIIQNYMKGSGIQLNTGNTIIESKR